MSNTCIDVCEGGIRGCEKIELRVFIPSDIVIYTGVGVNGAAPHCLYLSVCVSVNYPSQCF